MNSLSLIEEAGQNLRSNWLRSLLSVIGIIIGTLTIFLILALTFTTKLTLNRQFESMGSHVLFVMQDYASLAKNQHLAFLSELDIGLLERELHGIKSLCLNESNDISYPFEDGMVGKVNLVGTQPDYRPIQHVLLTKGRFISDLDIESRDRVCVV
ncbi:MAG: ABC transporter permease, partial [Candidatus Margulisiibacteriota bacterium]